MRIAANLLYKSRSGSLVKTGPGVLNLGKRQKPFTGPIVVSNGTVEVDIKILGTNDITVASGAHLKIACPYSTPYIDPESTIDMATDANIELSGDRAVTVKQLAIGGKFMRGDGRKYGSSQHAQYVDVVDDVHFSGGGILVVTGHVYRGISIGFR